MAIGTTAALIGLGIGAAGSVASSAIGAHSASSAASQQKDASQQAIDEQKRQFDITQANEQPWLTAGTGALSQLTAGTQPGGSLVAAYPGGPFVAPTLNDTNDPGYMFRLQQGAQALLRAQNASGGASTGGTLAALTRYGQDYGSNEYQNVYGRALQDYNTNYNVWNTTQGNNFNRLAALAGLGQNATNTLATTGANNANTIANLITGSGNAGAAGTLGIGSSINSGIQNGLNSYWTGTLLNSLTGGSGSGKTPAALPARYNPFQYISGLNPASYPTANTGYEGM